MQNVDFNNPSADTIFELCMGELKFYYSVYKGYDIQIRNEAHRDFLVKYNLQAFNKMFIEYQKKWFARQDSMFRLKKNIFIPHNEKLKYSFQVAKALKMLLLDETKINRNLIVSFTDVYDRLDIIDITLLNQMREVFKTEFESLHLNDTEYSREEALDAIKDLEDIEWLSEYGGDCFDGRTIFFDAISEELIEAYQAVHYKPRETTLELVCDVLHRLESSIKSQNSKVGAKIKNLNIGELAKRLSYIHRIDQYLNQKNCNSIKDFPLSNETCRFIYEYFEFWGLLYDHVVFDKFQKEKRANYIKSLIRNNLNFLKKGVIDIVEGYTIIEPDLDSWIDLFKKVKEGLLTPEEFYEKMSSLQE